MCPARRAGKGEGEEGRAGEPQESLKGIMGSEASDCLLGANFGDGRSFKEGPDLRPRALNARSTHTR